MSFWRWELWGGRQTENVLIMIHKTTFSPREGQLGDGLSLEPLGIFQWYMRFFFFFLVARIEHLL